MLTFSLQKELVLKLKTSVAVSFPVHCHWKPEINVMKEGKLSTSVAAKFMSLSFVVTYNIQQ